MNSLRLNPVIIIGLKIFFYQVTFLLGTIFLPSTLHAEINAIAPDRTITVVADQPDVLEWKKLWDKARENVRENLFAAASKNYAALLKIKPNIEEANWEFCKVLLLTEDFSSALRIIIPLVEKNPFRIDYLLAAGTIALQQKNYTHAIKYYGKVYELDPEGSQSTAALGGFIDSLKGKSSYETAFPLLEQLHIREPENVTRLHELARMAKSQGKTKKAKLYYSKLLNQGTVDDRILFQASELFDDKDSREVAVPLWEEYIRRNPNYLPFRQKLVEFYLAENKGMAALPHLLFIDDQLTGDAHFHLQIAKIYLRDAGRPDKALSYYEKYLAKNPDDKIVQSYISNIQSILANDFLSIVENDGAWLLWRDLMEVTPNRLGIYLEMAKLLERKRKFEELLEILLIISENKPDDDKINYRIVDLYRQKKEYGRALNYLGKITPSNNSTKKHFLLKGDIEELAGFEEQALVSYNKALKVDSTDLHLRKTCITRAGALGLVEELEKLFTNTQIRQYNSGHLDFILNYFEQLSYNSLFSRLTEVYGYFLDVFKNDPATLSQLQFHRVDTLRQQGEKRKAEELLRKIANSEQSEVEALFRLAINAINDRDIQTSKAWYNAFETKIDTYPSSEGKNALQTQKALLKIKTLLAAGDLPDAASLVIDLKKKSLPANQDQFYGSIVYPLEKEFCWHYLEKGDYSKCEEVLKTLHNAQQFDPEITVIKNIMREKSGRATSPVPSQDDLIVGKQPLVSRLLQVVQVELKHKEYNSARQHLDRVLNTGIDSLVSELLLAELSLKKGDMNTAVDLYQDIFERFPQEKHFLKKLVVTESKRGNYKNGLAALLKSTPGLHKIDTAATYNDLSHDFEEVLILARMLWGDRQLEKSLKVYQLLLNPAVIDLLGKRFELENIYYHYFSKDNSFWTTLRYLLQTKPEVIAELMEPPFLIDNLGNESGKIVVDYYQLYSWQKLTLNEYLARKAIVQRDYVIAERNYKRILEEEEQKDEESVESLADLASIYDRFGQYRKEAQVYEVMRNSGVTSSELESAIEKSSAKIRPHSGLEGTYLKKDGREGRVNLENMSLGASLLFTPDLEKDVTFLFLHNEYSKTENSENVSSSFLESTGTIELLTDTDVLYAAQAEKLNGRTGTNFYYFLGLKSRLNDYFRSHIEAYKKRVDDTLEAVLDGVYSDGFEIGLSGETPVGLLFGGDYRHRYYSDSNSQDQFHGYSSYAIYSEDVHFSVQYDYRFLKNSESNMGTATSIRSKRDDLYWKPDSYTEHRMTAHFQQLIKGHYGADGLKSYYSFDNSLGYEEYEDTQNIIYTGKFDIFLEMSPHFLLNGNFIFVDSSDYEERSGHLSLLYRW